MKNNTSLLALFIVLLGFPQVSETCITPSLQSIAVGLKADIHIVEASLGVFFAGFALGVSFWGIASDWWGRRKSMLAGLAIYILATFWCATSTNVSQLLIATFIQALGVSCGSVITMTALRDLCDEKERAGVFALIGMSIAFSPAIGPLLGTWLDAWFGWRANFIVLSIIGSFILAWSFIKFPETRKPDSKPQSLFQIGQLVGIMLRDRRIWACSALIGICNGSLFSFFAEGPFIFIEHLGLEPSYYGWIGISVSMAILVSSIMSRRWVIGVSSESLITRGAIWMAVGSLLYAIATVSVYYLRVTGISPSLVLIASLFVVFFGMGLIIPNCLSVALQDYKLQVGSAGSVFGCAYYCIISLLTGGMSVLHNGSIIALPAYLAVLALSCISIAYSLQVIRSRVL